MNYLIAELDFVLDKFFKNDYQEISDDVSSIIKRNNKQNNIRSAIEYYSTLLSELESIPNDESLKEAYSKLKKAQLLNYISFVNKIISELTQEKINNLRQIVRKPRKRKEKTAAQLTKKVKYLSSYPDLNVTSLDPTAIIGCTTLWLYNIKNRKLAKYVATDKNTLSVKGSTILNYDEKRSYQKTIRKPKEFIPFVIMDAWRTLSDKFDSINAKQQSLTGRINSTTLILRTIK